MATYFKNPANQYVVKATGNFWLLWALLFGPFYFAYKGLWGHTFFGILAAIATFGLSWLVYPFFAGTLVRRRYLEMGWLETSPEHERASRLQQQRATRSMPLPYREASNTR